MVININKGCFIKYIEWLHSDFGSSIPRANSNGPKFATWKPTSFDANI